MCLDLRHESYTLRLSSFLYIFRSGCLRRSGRPERSGYVTKGFAKLRNPGMGRQVRLGELRTAEEEWLVRSGGSTLTENADRVRQKTWDLPLAGVVRDRLIEEFDQIARTRILASSCKESGL